MRSLHYDKTEYIPTRENQEEQLFALAFLCLNIICFEHASSEISSLHWVHSRCIDIPCIYTADLIYWIYIFFRTYRICTPTRTHIHEALIYVCMYVCMHVCMYHLFVYICSLRFLESSFFCHKQKSNIFCVFLFTCRVVFHFLGSENTRKARARFDARVRICAPGTSTIDLRGTNELQTFVQSSSSDMYIHVMWLFTHVPSTESMHVAQRKRERESNIYTHTQS